jgi:1-acyl-sn-glycerol-3-phosphate acyltransferase
VFVDRQDKNSREQARRALYKAERYPPIALFPEGGIYSPAEKLHPFRYGAFEIAVEKGISFLPCALIYDPVEIVFWAEEPLTRMIWRFACYRGPIHARLHPLHAVHPHPEDDARQLALETHGALEAILNYSHRADDILKTGI